MFKNLKLSDFPIQATSTSFGRITLLGFRIQSPQNNNLMFMIKLDGEYVWIYDHNVKLLK